jgi:hypothetical protein
VYSQSVAQLQTPTGSLTLPDEAGTVLTSASSLASDNLTGTVTVSGGNVGIGTTSPATSLHVKASTNTTLTMEGDTGAGSSFINFSSSSLTKAQISGFKSGASGGEISLSTNNSGGSLTERMRIATDNKVYIACTATPSATVAGVRLGNPTEALCAFSSGAATVETYQLGFYNGNGLVGKIYTSGSATTYATSSDYRLKQDWQLMSGASERVLALKPVNFAWKLDGSRVDGFLAHEAQEIVPECVTGTKDAMRDEEYEVTAAVLDADGMVVTEAVMGTRSVPDYQGIDQSKLVPLLTAALQEALTEISALKVRVAALEAV